MTAIGCEGKKARLGNTTNGLFHNWSMGAIVETLLSS
jgi:hypothetical protein